MISKPYNTPKPIKRKKLASYDDGGGVGPLLKRKPFETNTPRPKNWSLTGQEYDADGNLTEGFGYVNPDDEVVAKDEGGQNRKGLGGTLGDGLKVIPFALNIGASIIEQQDQQEQMRARMMQINRQKPIWDYNSMYGDGQPIIKAKNGARVRSATSEGASYRIDDGEFLMLPDGKLELAKGSKTKTDDIATILPDGSKIFSNTLKPNKSKDTFAKLASKLDYSKELEMLENPYTTPVSKTSAERMLQRKQKKLNTLFEEQQSLNGDSQGEMSEFVDGGMAYDAWMMEQDPNKNTSLQGGNGFFNMNSRKYNKSGNWWDETDILDPVGAMNPAQLPMQEERDFTFRRNKKMLDANGRMMEFKDGGETDGEPRYSLTEKQLQALDNKYGKDRTYWSNAFDALNKQLIKDGKAPVEIKNIEDYQSTLGREYPTLLTKEIQAGNLPLTKKHRDLLKTDKTSYLDLSDSEKAKATNEILIQGYNDNKQGFRRLSFENEDGSVNYDSPQWKALPDSQKKSYQAAKAEGNKYEFNDTATEKNKYRKQNLPFYQAIPELAGFVNSLNTYNYQTPDYQHYEINPNKLNIQPQLQSIDSSLNAITQTTTGNPQIDNARKVGAFTQALNAKQQVFANKQNYDAEKEFQASQFNISARTQEQNLDVAAMDKVYNEYMPLAKDFAAGERIAAISSLTTKYALNAQNENEKALWLDNFYQNVEVDKDGNLNNVGKHNFNKPLYTVDPKTGLPSTAADAVTTDKLTKSTPSNPIGIDGVTPPLIEQQELSPYTPVTLPSNGMWNNKPRKSFPPFYDESSPLDGSPVRISNKYGSFIRK